MKAPEKQNPSLIEYLLWLAGRSGLNLKVFDRKSSNYYQFAPLNDPDSRGFVIDDPALFTQTLYEFYDLFLDTFLENGNAKEIELFIHENHSHERFFDFLTDMTPSDYKDWQGFFNRRMEELRNGPLIPCGETLIYGNDRQRFDIVSTTSPTQMEGYFQFHFEYHDPETKLFLSEVRYGRTSSTEAVVYSLQNPWIHGKSFKHIKNILSRKSAEKETFKTTLEPMEARQLFLVNEEWSDQKVLDYFKDTDSGDPVDRLQALGVSLGHAFDLNDYYIYLKEEPAILKTNLEFETNQEEVKKINRRLRKKLPENLSVLRQVPGQALLSMLMAIKVLHADGVRKIRIPLKLPARIHFYRESLDQKIFEDKVNLMRRLEYELTGFKIINKEECALDLYELATSKEGGPGVNYLEIELEESLSPRRQAVLAFWDGEPMGTIPTPGIAPPENDETSEDDFDLSDYEWKELATGGE